MIPNEEKEKWHYHTVKKLESIFPVDIQCQLYGFFIIQKTSILYIMGKILLYFFKRAHMKNIGFEKKTLLLTRKN